MHAGDIVETNRWKVTVSTATHVQPYLECLAFRVESDEGTLVYSGDSGGVPEDMIELARGWDVLVHMCHYFSGTEPTEIYREVCGNHVDCARIAREAEVGTLVLTHVLEHNVGQATRGRSVPQAWPRSVTEWATGADHSES